MTKGMLFGAIAIVLSTTGCTIFDKCAEPSLVRCEGAELERAKDFAYECTKDAYQLGQVEGAQVIQVCHDVAKSLVCGTKYGGTE